MRAKSGDPSSSALARRALFVTATLALAGSGLGIVGACQGALGGLEIALVASCFVFSAGTLVVLRVIRNVPLQTVATASTIFFAAYLSAGSVVALFAEGQHLDFFVYLLWFFPLTLYNKLVNAPAVGRVLGRSLFIAPVLVIACLSSRLLAVFTLQPLLLVAAYVLSYVSYALTLDLVTQYREKYIMERERAEARNVESKFFERISDDVMSLDAQLRLVYVNDAACSEFGIARNTALGEAIADVLPRFFSSPILSLLQAAARRPGTSIFEGEHIERDAWYELRNITESASSGRRLALAHNRLSETAELLDKAQDAIFVIDMDGRFIYWNKGAHRLYGWTAGRDRGTSGK
jgi:PAS domain-containing protein